MLYTIITIISVYIPFLIECRPNKFEKSYCLVRNSQYENEFLYSSIKDLDHTDEMKRKVYVNTANDNKIKSLDQLRWIFEPVDWMNGTYYITNIEFNEHLCASHIFTNRSKAKRRIVNLVKMNKESLKTNKKCIWKPEPIDNHANESRFFLKNLYYKEPLYAASSFNKLVNHLKDRHVYTWYKDPDSKQFIWIIYCSKALNLNWSLQKI